MASQKLMTSKPDSYGGTGTSDKKPLSEMELDDLARKTTWRDAIEKHIAASDDDFPAPRNGQKRADGQAKRTGEIVQELHEKSSFESTLLAIIGLLGVAVWIIQNELCWVDGESRDYLLWISSGLTLIALLFLWLSYISMIQIESARCYELDALATNYQIVQEVGLLSPLLIESFILLIHPFPGSGAYHVTIPSPYPKLENAFNGHPAPVGDDEYNFTQLLGVAMLLARCYLVARLLARYSVFYSTQARTLAVAYEVELSVFIMFKQVINSSLICLFVGFCYLLGVFAYASTVFDRGVSESPPMNFADNLWMTIITMTTVGYGEITPHTYGGRFVMAIASLLSLVVFACIITSIINELTPERTEIKLGALVEKMQNRKACQEAAATLIEKAMALWMHRVRVRKGLADRSEVDEKALRLGVYKAARAHREARQARARKVDDDVAVTALEILNQTMYIEKANSEIVEAVKSLQVEMTRWSAGQEAMAAQLALLTEWQFQARTGGSLANAHLPGAFRGQGLSAPDALAVGAANNYNTKSPGKVISENPAFDKTKGVTKPASPAASPVAMGNNTLLSMASPQSGPKVHSPSTQNLVVRQVSPAASPGSHHQAASPTSPGVADVTAERLDAARKRARDAWASTKAKLPEMGGVSQVLSQPSPTTYPPSP